MIKMIKMKGAAKKKDAKETLGTPELFLYISILGAWDNMAHPGYLKFYLPRTLGYPILFYFIFILQFLQNSFQSGSRNSCIIM